MTAGRSRRAGPARTAAAAATRRGLACSAAGSWRSYELVVPPGVTAELQTVNGDVRVEDLDGELDLETSTASIDARGVAARRLEARPSTAASTPCVAALRRAPTRRAAVGQRLRRADPPEGREVRLVGLDDERHDRVDLSAAVRAPSSRGVRREDLAEPRARAQAVVVTDDEATREVDLSELDQELAESMKDVERAIESGTCDARAADGHARAQREMRRIRGRRPAARVQRLDRQGRRRVQPRDPQRHGRSCSPPGRRRPTRRPLVSERRTARRHGPARRARPAPQVRRQLPRSGRPGAARPRGAAAPRAAASRPRRRLRRADFDGEIVRGDVAGDFLSTSSGGSYRIGKVSGRVKILTHSGEIRVGGGRRGRGPEDLRRRHRVGPVTGDLKASTAAGDIRVQTRSPAPLLADTAGGDVRIERVGGSLDAKTAGGDIASPRVGGSVRAVTAGGDVRIGVASRDVRGRHHDPQLGRRRVARPAGRLQGRRRALVTGADEDETAIRSDFPDLIDVKKPGTQRATAELNGGGEKIVVRTSSGTIRLRKGAQDSLEPSLDGSASRPHRALELHLVARCRSADRGARSRGTRGSRAGTASTRRRTRASGRRRRPRRCRARGSAAGRASAAGRRRTPRRASHSKPDASIRPYQSGRWTSGLPGLPTAAAISR